MYRRRWQAFDLACGRVGAEVLQRSGVGEGEQGREIDARVVECDDEAFEAFAALGEGQRAEVFAVLVEEIVGAQHGGALGDLFCRDGRAVEALLQLVERGDAACR